MTNGSEETGVHLHFEVREDGKPVDPTEIVKKYTRRIGMKIKLLCLIFFLVPLFTFYSQSSYEYIEDEGATVWNEGVEVELQSINKILSGENVWELGEKISSSLTVAFVLEDPFFELKMGKLSGYEVDSTLVAWNNKNRIVFISTINENAKTPLGISVGSSKEDVLKLYGQPSIMTNGRFRYDNLEFEHQGMVIYFVDSKVFRITCFAAI